MNSRHVMLVVSPFLGSSTFLCSVPQLCEHTECCFVKLAGDIFPVVSFTAGEAKEAFLEDRITTIPQREREADELLPIGDAAETIFVPAIRLRASVIVREIIPGHTIGAIVLTDCAPGALAEVGPPTFPTGNCSLTVTLTTSRSGRKRYQPIPPIRMTNPMIIVRRDMGTPPEKILSVHVGDKSNCPAAYVFV